jgi:predicted MFS family arabinose efflux permease
VRKLSTKINRGNALSLQKSRFVLIVLSSIMSIRMLGLFMILPVFSAYAMQFAGATHAMIGITLGVYGLTQAMLQIPFGMLSDHLGRKRVIYFGLSLLFIGSIIAAQAHSIYTLCFARALQGSGAIGSTVLALLSDLTRDESRSKAMAFVGLAIGFAFTIAMILGPMINHYFHLAGIFTATALFALIGMGLLFLIPTPPKPLKTTEKFVSKFSSVLRNRSLLRLDAGIFFLHACLTALFIAIPILLTQQMQLSTQHQIFLYLIVLVFAFMFALPFIIVAEKKRKMRSVFIGAIATIFCAQLLLAIFYQHLAVTAFLLFVFFTAFTLLEATLPSLVSKIAPIQNKGAAMGLYSSSQFFGIFVGGSLGGLIYTHGNVMGIFAFCAGITLIWLCFAMFMQEPPYLSTLTFPMHHPESHYQHIRHIAGVMEVAVIPEEGMLYIKADKLKLDEPVLQKALGDSNLV